MKSSTSSTVDKAAKLGSSSGSSIDKKKSNGGQVLSKEIELGNLIYKFNTIIINSKISIIRVNYSQR